MKQFVPVTVSTTAAAGVAYLFSTFATIQYVDARHESVTAKIVALEERVKETNKLLRDLMLGLGIKPKEDKK